MADTKQEELTKYLLYRHAYDGEPITNLKMQKLLYYVYVWYLVKKGERCFDEKFQAWPIGPVLQSVYDKLKVYGSSPIDVDFSDIKSNKDVEKLRASIGKDLVEIADEVYEKYGLLSAFELVNLTHNELPWKNARAGLAATEISDTQISDDDILKQYDKEKG